MTEEFLEVAFDTIKVMLSVGIMAIICYKLTVKHDRFTPLERWGMGIQGAGCAMMIGPITFTPSPFDDWSVCWFLMGTLVYYTGRLTRHRYVRKAEGPYG